MTILAGHHTLLQVFTPSRALPSVPDPWHLAQEQRSVIQLILNITITDSVWIN